MLILRFIGTFAIVPTTLLLATSFFVLLGAESIQVQALKLFGYFVAGLLWVVSAAILFMGIYALITGRNPLKSLMQHTAREETESSRS